jgi:hypothetical protein
MSDHTEQIQSRMDAARRQMCAAIDQMNLAAAKAALANYRLAESELAIAGRLPEGWPTAYTEDRVLIVPGLVVLDYNWRVGQVLPELPHESHGVHWFRLTTGSFDGTRMTTRHPKGNGQPLTEADLDSGE